ncbi:fimbrial assembly protein [Shewanella sp. AS16]|uniref:PilN domain-containing protein n=1 Tax=Shewanella sp. AS16 TaxID=2907625 RepID=UPI001F1A9B11|nr:PilN domain-containing protein [Shewanella sp. AS16]MCE9685925.1 fimbrial assembly protein [Shewanella sp. AS16]
MIKTRVNLFRLSLLPPQRRLTLTRLVAALGVLLVLTLLTSLLSHWQLSRLEQQQRLATAQQQRLQQQKSALEARLQAHKPDAALVAKVELLSQRLELKRLLMGELSQRASLTSHGYASLLKDLALVADSNIWLSRIKVDEQAYVFEGYSRQPQGVPQWIARLESTQTLKGETFATMTMDQGDDKPLAFTLTSMAAKEEGQ